MFLRSKHYGAAGWCSLSGSENSDDLEHLTMAFQKSFYITVFISGVWFGPDNSKRPHSQCPFQQAQRILSNSSRNSKRKKNRDYLQSLEVCLFFQYFLEEIIFCQWYSVLYLNSLYYLHRLSFIFPLLFLGHRTLPLSLILYTNNGWQRTTEEIYGWSERGREVGWC